MPIREEANHVDTSCLFFLRGAFSVLPHRAMMPRRLSPACDRVLERGLAAARVERPTVHLYAAHYRAVGETPPPGATPSVPVHDAGLAQLAAETGERDRPPPDGLSSARRGWRQAPAQRQVPLRIGTQVQALPRRPGVCMHPGEAAFGP
jgi:hypothetical protein